MKIVFDINTRSSQNIFSTIEAQEEKIVIDKLLYNGIIDTSFDDGITVSSLLTTYSLNETEGLD